MHTLHCKTSSENSTLKTNLYEMIKYSHVLLLLNIKNKLYKKAIHSSPWIMCQALKTANI